MAILTHDQETARAQAERVGQRWKRELEEQLEVNKKLEAEVSGLGEAVDNVRKQFGKLSSASSPSKPGITA